MKKISFLLVAIILLGINAFAQTTDFSGNWNLDKDKSKLDERMAKSIEGQTLTVSQTATEFKVDVKTKRMPPPEGQGGQPPMGPPRSDGQGNGQPMPPPNGEMRGGRSEGEGRGQGGGMGGGQGRGGMRMGMDGTTTYEIGKETTMNQETPAGSIPVSLKAKFDKGVLKLTRSSTFSTPMGEISIENKEEWSLSADGNTLTVKREMITPRGTNSSESVYTKGTAAVTESSNMPKIVSGGVVNGKAINLPKPAYPPAAMAVGASGAVNVEVIIDESGNVISAKAVSGHPLLQSAAEEAARKAQFSPTLLQGQAVKVKGVLVYQFTADKKPQ
jgi:TonB family protein